MLDLRYVRPGQHDAYQKAWSSKLQFKKDMKTKVVENVIALPVDSTHPSIFGPGGIVDSHDKFVQESSVHYENRTMLGPGYKIETSDMPILAEEYIYLGAFFNHWGHFLANCTARIYYAQRHQGKKCIFVILKYIQDIEVIESIQRFIELSGIKEIAYINKPCKIKSLIIPEESYVPLNYYTQEFLDTFTFVKDRINPNLSKTYDKVFFSRTLLMLQAGREFGNELIDDVFTELGYAVVHPETESLDNQISYWNNATMAACVEGSLVHSLVFANKGHLSLHVINKMPYVNRMALDSCKMANIKPIFCDFYAYKYPTQFGKGPFIFVKNKYMDDFMQDHCCQCPDNYYFSEDHLAEMIKQYEVMYRKFWPNSVDRPLIGTDPSGPIFYDPKLLVEWIEQYFKYENLPDQIHQEDNWPAILKDKLKDAVQASDATLPYLLYECNVVGVGWLGYVCAPSTSGLPRQRLPVEAVRIRIGMDGIHVLYQTFHLNSGWSAIAADGQVCGAVGQGQTAYGIKVWLANAPQNWHVRYRVYTDRWNEWHADGDDALAKFGIRGLQLALCRDDRQGPDSSGVRPGQTHE